ncbi:DNA repair protein RAD51 homolog 2 isoform X2 [Lingula anatina]|nr:DNA repair protein RAD51 homolog 2 isoform X2 [Lingula anatina]|eukprot:XP_023930394.1 DNA repair protein RAD51 homolog 2 isoform X2 [Lingula anatina]
MLSVLATVPVEMGGLGGAVVYIDTESAFSAERLVEVAQNRFPGHFISEESLLQLTSRVHVYHESTSSQLLKRLQTLEEDIIEKKVKLIILDSVASLVRKEFDSRTSQNLYERTNLLAKEAAILKYLAESFYIPVVVTNQITTRFGFNLSEVDVMEKEDSVTSSENGYVTAALGNTWSHSVNTRLIIQYLDDRYRQILIAKSPVAPFAAHEYDIQDKGIVLKCNGARQYEGTDPGLQQIRVRTSLQKECFPT